MSIHSQDSPIAAVPGYNATALRRRDLRPSSPSRPAIFVNDSNTEDWFQQKFHEQGPKDANLRAFLVDYAQCKNSRLEGLFQSMVACNYFEPPSTTQYWAPRNVLSNGQGLEGPDTSKSPTFSQALNQFRLFLRQGDPGCARFCILSSCDDDSIQSRAFGFKKSLFATVEQLERKYQAPMLAVNGISPTT